MWVLREGYDHEGSDPLATYDDPVFGQAVALAYAKTRRAPGDRVEMRRAWSHDGGVEYVIGRVDYVIGGCHFVDLAPVPHNAGIGQLTGE